LVDEDGSTLKEWRKTERKPDDPPARPIVPEGHHVRRSATMLDRQGQALVQWVSTEADKEARDQGWLDAMRALAREHSGAAKPTPAPKFVAQDWLSAYPIGDAHLGLLAHESEVGENHDLSIGARDLLTAFDLLVAAAQPSRRALVIDVGDYWHAQDNQQRTPGHGHKLDVDGRAGKVWRKGMAVARGIIDRLLTKHETVEFWAVQGNHDPDLAIMLGVWLEGWYRNEPRVIVDPPENPHHMAEFGVNMIVSTHGHSLKRDQVPGFSSAFWPEVWGRTRCRRAFTGHIHHETHKEYHGMTVESANTIAGRDAYTHAGGYMSERALEVVGFHRTLGLKSRGRVELSEIRGAQR